MTKQSTNTPSQNSPCVCGSGKKSKDCCEAAPPAKEESARKPWILVLGLLGVIAIGILAYSLSRTSSDSGTSAPAPAGASAPQPWQYDAASDQHWDPSHQHWHQGRPPGSAGEGSAPSSADAPSSTFVAPSSPSSPPAPATGAGAAPKPWQYDAANNRHWDPSHKHWHDGPPPPQAPKP